jgi:hypothetical protein
VRVIAVARIGPAIDQLGLEVVLDERAALVRDRDTDVQIAWASQVSYNSRDAPFVAPAADQQQAEIGDPSQRSFSSMGDIVIASPANANDRQHKESAEECK